MASIVEDMIGKSIKSLIDRNMILAKEVINSDSEVNNMEVEIDNLCIKILALYHPEAEDLSVFKQFTSKARTAVHCPCTLSHGQKLGASLERILKRAGIPLAETTEKHLCCGSAGAYSLLQPDISQRLLTRKLKALSVDEPEQIVTANIGCQLHLGTRSDVPVMHWIELLDSATWNSTSGRR